MAIRDLIFYPDESLHKVCSPVTIFDNELKVLVSDMMETMYEDEGIGLAAPQIGVSKRIAVINVEGREKPEQELILINPEFITKEGETGIEEGCLSVPELRAFIKRAEKVTVRAQDLEGNFFEKQADGLLAICMQHEIDHLDGHLFIDYLSIMKKNLYRAKAAKLARERKKQKADRA